MAGENTAETILAYRVDTGSVQAAVAANKKVEASINDIKKAAAGGGGTLRFDSIEQATAALGLSAQQLGVAEEKINAAKTRSLILTERLAAAEKVRANAVEETALAELRAGALGGGGAASGGGSNIGRGIQRASRGLFNLPDVQLTQGISTTVVSRLGLVTGGVVEAAGITTAALGGIVAVGAVVAVAIGTIIDAENKRAEAAKKAAAQILTTSEQVAGGATTRDLQEQNRALDSQRSVLEEGRASLESYRDRIANLNKNYEDGFVSADGYRSILTNINEELYDATGGALGLKDGLGQAVSSTGVFDQAIKQVQISIDEATGKITVNTIAMDSQGVAANNAAAAEEALRAIRQQAVEEIFQGQATYADAFVRGQSLTTEARDREVASLENQKASYEELIASGTLSGDQIQALNNKIDALDNQLAGLTDATTEYADSLAREEAAKQALTDRNQQILDLVGQEVKAREDLFEVQQKAADIVAKRDEDIADLRTDIADRAAQREEDLGEKRADIAENSADRIAKIERDAARSRQTSIGERDAYGFKQAEQRRADALADQSEADAKQFANLVKQAQKAERVEASSLDKRIAKITETANRAVEVENRKAAYLNNVIATSLTSQAFLTQNGMSSVVNTVATGWNAVVNYTTQAFNNILAATSARLTSAAPFPTLTSSIGAAQPSSQFNVLFDARLNQALNGASGNRLVRG